MTHSKSWALTLFLCFFIIIFSSCTSKIGYGLIMWSIPEQGIAAGDIVPVFIQSNIGNVYVIGLGTGGKDRMEIPLWQLTLYKTMGQAQSAANTFSQYRFDYAYVKLDGLPIRAEPENTAKMVYRLKEGEKIKILKQGSGTQVLSGKTALEGQWYSVMTDNGTTGWCFSYNLTLFDEREEDLLYLVEDNSGPDEGLIFINSRRWYPENYRTMVEQKRINLDVFNPDLGFFPGSDSLVARITIASDTILFPYTNLYKHAENEYRFEGTSLAVQIRTKSAILVSYTDDRGMPQAYHFISLDTSAESLIEEETERRETLLSMIKDRGPIYASGTYGVLQFLDEGRYLWNGWQALSPSVISNKAFSSGQVELRVFLGKDIDASYSGVLSFMFDGTSSWVHFLYRLNEEGLKLEHISESNIRDNIALSQNLSPAILFFTPEHKSGAY